MSFGETSSEHLQLSGFKCSLSSDVEKSLEVNRGSLLVPWINDKNLLIDRYDCRGYLNDISEYDADLIIRRVNSQTEEDVALEEMCNYERYLELQTDVHEVSTLQEEETKRSNESSRNYYSAVDFSYGNEQTTGNEVNGAPSTSSISVNETKMDETDIKQTLDEVIEEKPEEDELLYTCPPELILPPNITLPKYDKQATRIEATAIFIARHDTQMEIVIKAKQSNNPQFQFLNYDSDLNAFYRELVKQIKTGRYIPKPRKAAENSMFGPAGQTDASHNDRSITDDSYELKLPKVDISNTAYASLINRFKKSAAEKLASSSSPNSTTAVDSHQNTIQSPMSSPGKGNRSPTSDASSDLDFLPAADASAVDYEDFYQQYYKHYYSHYYLEMARARTAAKGAEGVAMDASALSEEEQRQLVADAAKAAASAASTAVNAVHQTNLANKQSNTPSSNEQRGIIDKMAEYVARNGDEFENVVKKQKKEDVRFTFLQTDHLFHEYYRRKKAEFTKMLKKNKDSTPPVPPSSKIVSKTSTQSKPDIDKVMSNGAQITTKPKLTAFSFRLHKSASSSKLKEMATSTDSQTDASASDLRISASCSNLLPGMDDYSSDVESENESLHDLPTSSPKKSLPIPTPPSNEVITSAPFSTPTISAPPKLVPPKLTAETLLKDVTLAPKVNSELSSLKKHQKSTSSRTAKKERLSSHIHRHNSHRITLPPETPILQQPLKTTSPPSFPFPATNSTVADFRVRPSKDPSPPPSPPPMTQPNAEELARLQLERRKRAALLVARLKMERGMPTVTPPVNPQPPPPPSSVPAAVAHAVVNQLKAQRERVLALEKRDKKQANKRAKSPPAAYAHQAKRNNMDMKEVSTYSRQIPSSFRGENRTSLTSSSSRWMFKQSDINSSNERQRHSHHSKSKRYKD